MANQANNICDKYDANRKIKLEFCDESEELIDSKPGISLTNADNSGQNILIENIKVENFDHEEVSGDINNAGNYEFELQKIETVKVETCVKVENDNMLEEDPLVIDGKIQIKLEVNELHSTPTEYDNQEVFCKDCNKTFSYHHYHNIHAFSHVGITPFICRICGKAFAHQSGLKIHKITHSDVRPYSCNTCGNRFKTKNVLLKHQSVHSDDRPFHCDLCDRKFKYDYHLKVHKLKHDNNRKYICEVCGKGFYDSTALKHHKKTHDAQKSIPCQECGKLFQGEVRLRDHVRQIHSVRKVQTCNYCGKEFKQKHMAAHIKTHTGEKPFSCELCTKSFIRVSALQVHMRTHTGETPYACELCESKFKYSHHLQRHMKVHVKKEQVFEKKSENRLKNV